MALRILAVLTRATVLVSILSTSALAAELKPETLAAWNSYLQREDGEIKSRAQPGQCFLWADAEPTRYQQAHAGTIVVEPVGDHNPRRVPQGLIHHWIGVAFIPAAGIEDVLSVTRDYAHYKDYYKPGVADARIISTTPMHDEFTIRFVNSSVLSKTSLIGTYSTDFVQLDHKRWYSISLTPHMEEVKDFGLPTEKRFLPDHGSGYIWRLYSTARLEERDGGVVIELEAIALSRDIPAALHWFVDPIVRRVSRDSLEKSLLQTSEAVHAHDQACAAQASPVNNSSSQIIVAGTCSHSPAYRHASNSDIRDQRILGYTSR